MDDNNKNFNQYVFLSTFARNLIELFVGTILFKIGFPLKSVVFYYFLVNAFSLLLCIPCSIICKKYSNKILSVIGILSFITLQIVLNYVNTNPIYLFITAFLFALYRRGYWISRRYYTLQVMNTKEIGKRYSIIAITNQLGVITSSYIGSLLLQYININVLTIISITLLLISMYYIFKLNFKHEINDTKIDLVEAIRITPKTSMLHIACYELQNVVKFFLPLYLVIYVKDTYTTIGIVSLIANIATLIFTYLYGLLINKDKNYLKLSILLVIIIKVLQINTSFILLMIVSFLEGFTSKMYEQSFHKEYIKLSKSYEFHNINFLYEIVQNSFRMIVVLVSFLFISDVKYMIYVTLSFMALALFVKFKLEPKDNNSEIIWEGSK